VTFTELMNVKRELFGEEGGEEEKVALRPEHYDPEADLEKERGPHYKTKNAGVMRFFTLDKAEQPRPKRSRRSPDKRFLKG
jgi:hypothetical protein